MKKIIYHNKNRINQVLRILLIVFITLGIWFIFYAFGGVNKFRQIINAAGPWAPLAYVLLKVMIYVAAPLSSLPFQILSGAIFGIWYGTFLTLIGSTVGGSINFFIGRYLGRPITNYVVGDQKMKKVDEIGNEVGGWRVLLLIRIFIPWIYDFVSYATGLTDIRFWKYLIVTFFGGVVPTFLWVGLGANINGEPLILIIISVVLFLISLIGLFLHRKLQD